ncbi:MAG: hypothetical protein IKR34_03050 [Candidatus Gastranaerophilales bacterium]|nr:hypothetical protein [Candidatus Gastranaerophilales bacterium]
MLLDKKYNQNENYYFNEFKNVSKETLPWLENLAVEYRCKIEKKEWKSKYNNYVIYDYEPFCSDGFEINVTLSSRQNEFLNFVRYLYDNKIQTIGYLKNCLTL